MLFKAKCLLMLLTNLCSRVLLQMHMSDTGLYLAAASYFSPFLKTRETLASRHSSGTSPRAKDSLKIRASNGEISLLHSFSTLAFSPSGPGALCTFSLSNSLVKPLGATVMSPMRENGLAPLEGESESPLHVKAD